MTGGVGPPVAVVAAVVVPVVTVVAGDGEPLAVVTAEVGPCEGDVDVGPADAIVPVVADCVVPAVVGSAEDTVDAKSHNIPKRGNRNMSP